MLKLMSKKIFTILRSKIVFISTYVHAKEKLHVQMYPLPLSNDLKIIPFQKVDAEHVTWAGRLGHLCVCVKILLVEC